MCLCCAIIHKRENQDHCLQSLYNAQELVYILKKEDTFREMVMEELGLLIEQKVKSDMDLFEQQVVEALEKTEKLVNNKKKKRKK